jgi:hypothetical protein
MNNEPAPAQAPDWHALASSTNEELLDMARWYEELQRGQEDMNATSEWTGGIECKT